jgi:hypothetical protein
MKTVKLMSPTEKMDIVKMALDARKQNLLRLANDIARDLQVQAAAIEKAAQAGDVQRLAWLLKNHDARLAGIAETVYEESHLLAGLEV